MVFFITLLKNIIIMNWKTWSILVSCVVSAHTALQGQQETKNNESILVTGEEELVMLKFEPNYTANSAQKRELFLYKRKQIDSMPISDRKKEKLIKILYKDLNSKEFDKALLANQHFQKDIDK